jgi:hypothetical protein
VVLDVEKLPNLCGLTRPFTQPLMAMDGGASALDCADRRGIPLAIGREALDPRLEITPVPAVDPSTNVVELVR